MGLVSNCEAGFRLNTRNWFAALDRSVKLKFYRLSSASSFVESFSLFPYLRFQIWFPSNSIVLWNRISTACRKELRMRSDVSKRFRVFIRKQIWTHNTFGNTAECHDMRKDFFCTQFFCLILSEREDHPTFSFVSKVVYVH